MDGLERLHLAHVSRTKIRSGLWCSCITCSDCGLFPLCFPRVCAEWGDCHNEVRKSDRDWRYLYAEGVLVRLERLPVLVVDDGRKEWNRY